MLALTMGQRYSRGPAAGRQSRHWRQQKQPGDYFCQRSANLAIILIMRVARKTRAHCTQTLSRALSGISRRRSSRKLHLATMSASTSGCESAPAAKRTKTATSKGASGVRRRFMPSWMNDFPWVTVSDGLMCYQHCTEAGKNVFTTTGCDKLKKDALRKHALTNEGRKKGHAACCCQYLSSTRASCLCCLAHNLFYG